MSDFVAQILVVEDETLQRTLLLDLLRTEGHLVLGVGSAEEAVGMLERTAVEVAVVDVFLPGRSGIELLRAIRAASPRTEVVVITARPSVQIATDCIQAGAVDFLLKPIDDVRLARSVRRAVEHGRMRGEAAAHQAIQRLCAGSFLDLPMRAVEAVRDLLLADETSLLVPSEDGGLIMGASTSLAPEVQASVRLRLGERIAGRVAVDGRPAFLPDSPKVDPRFAELEGNGRLISSIVYPLVCEGDLRGVLSIGRRFGSQAFRPRDVELTAGVAKVIGIMLAVPVAGKGVGRLA